ncbi:proline iminopeptidase-family hydrolase [Youngiibacter fragilis]|uniref:Proline iminopeptidase n=1 Tax=Youngiibacter fragilis 232.1 TaxID=994573 RepID=V7I1K7_9CLOT|nr:proline iminopeptidase-family hydrolase [Youngiibacter fragilis]ETA79753.1 proline iminopeptidase [Youngiibacter fragilis 232.1]
MEEGFISIRGKNIWYGVFGKEKEGTPMLVVHGGPGFCSVVESGDDLSEDRPVYMYDQLGSLRSDKADSIEAYTTEYFVEELDDVRKALGLDKVILMGHSWGGGLVSKYMLDRDPDGVRALVLNSPFLSARFFNEDVERNLARLPEKVRETIERLEKDGNYGDEYQGAIMEYYKVYGCRKRPVPEMVMKMMMTANYEVYGKLQGPSEVKLSGDLRDFDLMPQLGKLKVPVLLVSGDNDEISVDSMRAYQLAIPDSRLAIIPDAGHLNAIEQPEYFKAVVNRFARRF